MVINDKPVFVVGDCHGDLPVLQALLEQEGVSRGDGTVVVQLGDLGHFGNGSNARDREIYEFAEDHVDYVLWGNHDRAIWSAAHNFSGYEPPFPETREAMRRLETNGRLLLAASAHGFLLTHAGLHAAFRHQNAPMVAKRDVEEFVRWIDRPDGERDEDDHVSFRGLRDAISVWRGGSATAGGILWRDAGEKLYGDFRQVFGHTSKKKVRRYDGRAGVSYCIDVHDATNGRLAGIWLPEERVVEICVHGTFRGHALK